jgi:hypothetical protein
VYPAQQLQPETLMHLGKIHVENLPGAIAAPPHQLLAAKQLSLNSLHFLGSRVSWKAGGAIFKVFR